ncbi:DIHYDROFOLATE REDUCTASE [Encephalitozoon cuniculi GB-M1]|uniref:Dihydrofolate reductase n=1 Tax=Encephalitozoon cuniculi (strain GB-M1) TaxID=284813 RepID=DYR_ENCCU|nr:dihydrofolate reductase [Encephalitozoon cuniculi GB-M1]NP_001402232.1 dihydrofolate reductase [Encephalitozoon cuniculi GB-M1]NP_597137.1 dihydrofolate reductase [Encephalitozoon cuniculi GB-M1]O62583.1 RecName: Full=Dihydrofolate reductase [Encephalitozoon cuniculi GB-M1]CAA06647.1 dihydrofolate reductase [Encephalitozoon cuniculi]CAD24887.1 DIHYDROFOLATE REDUCTASE [Encephalitozoon cuniculi GB-M1]CAD25017.1 DIHYDROFOLATE REDUCTASE [Encephalitozoon cuniculi GB-M1]CAD26313.1 DIHYDROFOLATE
MLALVVALASHRGIGNANALPWPRPLAADMAWFRTLSQSIPLISPDRIALAPSASNAVVMGRRTWDSIPSRFRPLANRINVVLSRGPARSTENTFFIQTFEALDSLPLPPSSMTFVIGGRDVYSLALESGRPHLIFATEVFESPECDVFFPHIDWASYEKRDITRDVSRLIDRTLASAFYSPETATFTENGTSFKMFLYTKPETR